MHFCTKFKSSKGSKLLTSKVGLFRLIFEAFFLMEFLALYLVCSWHMITYYHCVIPEPRVLTSDYCWYSVALRCRAKGPSSLAPGFLSLAKEAEKGSLSILRGFLSCTICLLSRLSMFTRERRAARKPQKSHWPLGIPTNSGKLAQKS